MFSLRYTCVAGLLTRMPKKKGDAEIRIALSMGLAGAGYSAGWGKSPAGTRRVASERSREVISV
jgi:hypothetical protein